MKFLFHFTEIENENMPYTHTQTNKITSVHIHREFINAFWLQTRSFLHFIVFSCEKILKCIFDQTLFLFFSFHRIEHHERFPFVLLLRPSWTFITRCFITINLTFCPPHLLLISIFAFRSTPLICPFLGLRFILFSIYII